MSVNKNPNILIDPDLAEFLSSYASPIYAKTRSRAFLQAKVKHLYVFHDSPKDSPAQAHDLHSLIRIAKGSGLKVKFISPAKFHEGDQHYIYKSSINISETLRKSKTRIAITCLLKDYSFADQLACIVSYLARRKSSRKGGISGLFDFAATYFSREIEEKTEPIIYHYIQYVNNVIFKLRKKKEKINVESFEISRFTIRVKLISIISAIIFISLGAMTYFTSRSFNENAVQNIEENNLKLAQAFGGQIQSELEKIRYSTKLLTPASAKSNSASFFEDNPSFFYVARGNMKQGSFQPKFSLLNSNYLFQNKINKSSIINANLEHIDYIKRAAVKNSYVAFNASTGNTAILGLAYKTANDIVVIYLQPSKILKLLQKDSLIDIFVVNRDGDVIAHKETKTLLEHRNFIDLPIVKFMLQNSTASGQKRYTFENTTYMASFQILDVGRLGIVAQIDENTVFAPVRSIQTNNLLIVSIVLCLAILIVFYFSKTITLPIANLVYSAERIEQGDYKVNIAPEFRDEIGRLTASFGRMATGLGERERMKDAFGKFVNKEIAERVLKGEVNLGGENKEAAVFFSDLRGFTALSENMSPEKVVDFLNTYFTAMVRCVNETHGIIDKYIGDAIMAHWGAIGGKGNHTENAINASLMMRDALIEFNQTNQGKFPVAQIGIGINTGSVISGQIGSVDRLEYTVIGDAVNLASRVETLNKAFSVDILISTDSHDRVKDIFNVVPMPAIKVKGKAKPQIIYAVLGRKDNPHSLRSLGELRLKLDIKEKEISEDFDKTEEKFEVIELTDSQG